MNQQTWNSVGELHQAGLSHEWYFRTSKSLVARGRRPCFDEAARPALGRSKASRGCNVHLVARPAWVSLPRASAFCHTIGQVDGAAYGRLVCVAESCPPLSPARSRLDENGYSRHRRRLDAPTYGSGDGRDGPRHRMGLSDERNDRMPLRSPMSLARLI